VLNMFVYRLFLSCTHVCLGDAWVGWVSDAHSLHALAHILPDPIGQTPQKPMWMATPQSRAARANEMAECTDHQRPSAEQVPNESFWADQPGSHNLPSEVLSDVETEHCMTPCGA
jgi:hypothetical protein